MVGEATKPQSEKPSVLALIGGVLGAGVDLAVGRYAGIMLLFPAGFALLVGWILSKTVPAENKPMIPASAVQAGQGLWMVLAMVLLAQFDLTVIDAVILVAGSVWLAFWPSLVVVGLLICYQATGLVVNGLAFAEATPNTEMHKALLVHLALRAGAVVLMVVGLVKRGKQKKFAGDPSGSGEAVGESVRESRIVKKLLRKLPLMLFVVAVVAALAYGFRPVPAAVDVAEVTRGPLRLTVEKEGKTRVKNRYIVSAPLAGRMQRLKLKPGDPIDLRTALALIEPVNPTLLDARARAETKARVRVAEATLKRARVKLRRTRVSAMHARSEHDRLKRLGTSVASQQELETAAVKERTTNEEVREAEFGVQIADFELVQARAALNFLNPPSSGDLSTWRFEILSPIPRGRVLRVMKESTSVVTPGTEIMEVGDPDNLEAEIDLLTPDAVKVRAAMKGPKRVRVLLEHWGGEKPLEGSVRRVEPSGFTKTSALGVEEQRVNVLVDFKLPKGYRDTVGDAFRVEARIIVWESKDVLKVPAGALFRHGAGWAVFALADGKAALRPVQVGKNNGLEAQVLGGLTEGERVVVHPGDKIKDGVAIAPRPAGP